MNPCESIGMHLRSESQDIDLDKPRCHTETLQTQVVAALSESGILDCISHVTNLKSESVKESHKSGIETLDSLVCILWHASCLLSSILQIVTSLSESGILDCMRHVANLESESVKEIHKSGIETQDLDSRLQTLDSRL